MSTRPLHIYPTEGGRYVLCRGPLRQLVRGDFATSWSHALRGYMVHADRVPEIEARADAEGGWDVTVHEEVAR